MIAPHFETLDQVWLVGREKAWNATVGVGFPAI